VRQKAAGNGARHSLRAGRRNVVPADPLRPCRECGASVIWRRSGGRWQCFNADGATIHWDSCSQRRWTQVKATGTRFETETEAGYANSIHGTKFDLLIADGPKREIPTCANCVPPWEVCPNRCPIEFANHG
jgi:hypothetical protein